MLIVAACAPLTRPLAAQQPPPPPPPSRPAPPPTARDSTPPTPPADTTKPDSAARASVVRRPPADTIKSPLARPFTPRATEIGGRTWHWDRESLFASGALTLGDLLDEVPGVTSLMTGFILAPQVAAWYGDPGRVRIFLDGVELDAINARTGGIPDLATVPLWLLEDVQVERAALELRVHLRTWRVDRTAASTRADVLTGSENLNLYRGFFGRRLQNGAAFQLAAQQYSTLSRTGLDGDALGGLARLGWAGGGWSVDGLWLRQGMTRAAGARFTLATPVAGAIPPFKGNEGLAYVRVAWRDPDLNGPWLQLLASTISAGESAQAQSQPGSLTPPGGAQSADSVDTTAVRSQYVATAGVTARGFRLGAIGRIRSIAGKTYVAPGARAELDAGWLTVSAFGERTVDSTLRTDVLARLTPVSWLHVGGAVSRSAPANDSLGAAVTASRAEASLRVFGRWISAGVVTRSAGPVTPPIELDTVLRVVRAPAASGTIVSFRGRLLRGWSLDADAVRWDAAGPYRPETQARARLWFASSFLQRFPRGNFHVAASATLDYRSTLWVPSGTEPFGQSTAGYTALGSLLEIRISQAVISWQYRNMVGALYETYPGFLMPRLVSVYGVRWEFWN